MKKKPFIHFSEVDGPEDWIEFEGEDIMTTLEKIGDIMVERTGLIAQYEADGKRLKAAIEAAAKPVQDEVAVVEKTFREEIEAYNKKLDELIKLAKDEEASADE